MFNRLMRLFLKLFFDLLYHGMAFLYDTVADIVSLGKWKGWVYSIIPDLGNGLVIELGHGPGHMQKKMLEMGRPMIGIDESRQMSVLARKKLVGLPFSLVRADARFLPFPAGSVSTYAATFPSEYFLADQTLSEIARTLTSSGSMTVILAAWPGGTSLLAKAARLLFLLTGESPPENLDYSKITNKLADHGLCAEFQVRECHQSNLLLVFLKKVSQKSSN